MFLDIYLVFQAEDLGLFLKLVRLLFEYTGLVCSLNKLSHKETYGVALWFIPPDKYS